MHLAILPYTSTSQQIYITETVIYAQQNIFNLNMDYRYYDQRLGKS